MIVFLTFGLAGIIRGEIGSWTGGLVVGFLGGLSLGLDPIQLVWFTILCGLVFSHGWGRYISAIQTGKRPIWGWLHLTKLSLFYTLPILVVSNVKYSQLGWVLLVWPITLGVDKAAKKYLPKWDGWKLAEIAMAGTLGSVFYHSCKVNIPIEAFPTIVLLFGMMGQYKYLRYVARPHLVNIRVISLFILLPLFIQLLYYVGR